MSIAVVIAVIALAKPDQLATKLGLGSFVKRLHENSSAPSSTGSFGGPRKVFSICAAAPHYDCVIDGDTFYFGSQPIRIADIDAPEMHPSRCEREAQLGAQATRRLQALINQSGLFELRPVNRDEDEYGHKVRIVVHDGQSLGDILVSEGLAREWNGTGLPWC